jgi:hypothetical protein
MEKEIRKNGNLIGWQGQPLTEEEKNNKRVSEINYELLHAKKILETYRDEQIELRATLKRDFDNLSDYKQTKLKKEIRRHRAVLNGLNNYIPSLKREKEALSKSHPKNMHAQRTKEEKLQNRYNRIIEHCNKCGFQSPNCNECWVLAEKKKVEEKLNRLKSKNE